MEVVAVQSATVTLSLQHEVLCANRSNFMSPLYTEQFNGLADKFNERWKSWVWHIRRDTQHYASV